MGDALERLRAELDGLEPHGFDALVEEDLVFLTDAIHEAKRRHAAQLAGSIEESLGHLPRLLRGPVRAIMGIPAGGGNR